MILKLTLKKRPFIIAVLYSAFLLSNFAAQAGTTSLLKTTNITLPSGYTLSQFTQMNFADSKPTYGLTSDNNFFPSMLSASTPNISSYATTSTGYIILTDTTPSSPIVWVYNAAENISLNTIITGEKYISASAVGQSSVYGCSQKGSIYFINPSIVKPGSYTFLSNISSPSFPYSNIITCVADITSPQTGDVVYSLSMNSSYSYTNEYLCATTATGATACYPTEVLQSSDKQNIMASNGIVYVESSPLNGNNMTINAFTTSADGHLIKYPGFSTVSTPGFAAASPLVYGSDSSGKKMIYVVIQQNSTYQLQAINATTGALSWAYPFGANVKISNPFVTKNGNVFVVSSHSKDIYNNRIYGLTPEGLSAFGPNLYTLPLPQVSTPAVNLATADSSTLSNTIDIPATLADGKIVVYSMNMNW